MFLQRRCFKTIFVNMGNAMVVILQIFSLPYNLGYVEKTHLMNICKGNYIEYKVW